MTPIPLRQMVKANRPRQQVMTLRPIEPTQSMARDLASINLRIVRIWEAASPRIVDAYSRDLATMARDAAITRDAADWVTAVIEAVLGEISGEMTFWQQLIAQWAASSVKWHTRRIVERLKYAGDVDLSSVLLPSDVSETVGVFLKRNTSLISDVSEQTRARIADAVLRGLNARTPIRDVAREISQATGLARKRAIRIASDQAVKLSAALDRQRQLQLGFDGFIWRHSRKENFRPEHKARDGDFFRWDGEIARVDPPGHAPFCGCKAQASMEL